MRVTDRMMFEKAAAAVQVSRQRSQLAASEVSSGIRVQHAWDDAGAAGLIATHQLAQDRFAAISKAVGRTTDEVNAADGALQNLQNVLARARELAMQSANDSYQANDRAATAPEVDGLRKTAIALLNTQFGGRYLFGGFKDNAPPFDANGNYLGDTGVRQIEVAPGVLQSVSLRADIAIKGAGGGVDILATLEGLTTALNSNDVATIRGSLTLLTDSISQLSVAQGQVGSAANILDVATATLRQGRDGETSTLAHLTDADIFESSTQLALAERALEAAMSASAKSFHLSLLDKL